MNRKNIARARSPRFGRTKRGSKATNRCNVVAKSYPEGWDKTANLILRGIRVNGK